MMKTAKDTERGITIIETMIVLALAALILLIVLRAIPALQRSGHNNQRRQDVQVILESVSHYELNDSGKFPDDCGNGPPQCTSPGGSTPNDYFLRYAGDNLTFYVDTDPSGQHVSGPHVISRHLTSSSHINEPPNHHLDNVFIYNYQICDQTGGGAHFQGAGYSDVVALFAIEASGGNAPQCQQL